MKKWQTEFQAEVDAHVRRNDGHFDFESFSKTVTKTEGLSLDGLIDCMAAHAREEQARKRKEMN